MTSMLVDVGNTRVKWRLVERGTTPVDGGGPSTDSDALGAQWEAHRGSRVATVCISNVAGADRAVAIERLVRTLWPAARIEHVVPRARQCGVINGYADVASLGPDRWLAAIAAHRRQPAASLLVCSFGTATTIDLVQVRGEDATFVGGLILPGFGTMHRSLARDTARLPAEGGTSVDFGTGTGDAISSGIVAAQAGAVAEALRRATKVVEGAVVRCILAGGHAERIAPHLDPVGGPYTIVPDLVLQGLGLLADDLSPDR